jgi:hypothetical protein
MEDEMNRDCRMHGRIEECVYKVLVRKPELKRPLGNTALMEG